MTSSGRVAEAWRGDSRQALLARLLRGLDEQGLDRRGSRAVGALCGAAGSADVIYAHAALLARDGDVVLTSDALDVRRPLSARGCRADVKPC